MHNTCILVLITGASCRRFFLLYASTSASLSSLILSAPYFTLSFSSFAVFVFSSFFLQGIQDLLICLEMLVASVFFFYAFPLSDYLRSPCDQAGRSMPMSPTRHLERHQRQHHQEQHQHGGQDFHRLKAEDESGLHVHRGGEESLLDPKVGENREGRETIHALFGRAWLAIICLVTWK